MGQQLDLESACVGGDECVGAEEGFDAFEEGALEVELFDDGFADPVGFADPAEVIGDGAKADGIGGFGDVKVGRPGSFGAIESRASALFAEVEKSDLEAKVGEVGGDSGAHRAGSDDADVALFVQHGVSWGEDDRFFGLLRVFRARLF